MAKHILWFVACIIFLSVGFVSGRHIGLGQADENGIQSSYELREGGYTFINPLLECEIASSGESSQFPALKPKVESFIEESKREGRATEVSVYFRDLNLGPWIGIDEHEEFSPASLLKVPTMIAYYKHAESDPEVLWQSVLFDEETDFNLAQNILPAEQLEKGKEYTIEELIFYMIVHSDNNAKKLLDDNISAEYQDKTFQELGLEIPGVVSVEDFTSVKNYASFFRILYNATFLNREFSERALEVLSRTRYDEGIVAGVPEGTLVAHKFGEREYEEIGARQLHDCGIVYHSKTPYLLCVMTRGSDFTTLASVIRDISQVVYGEVDAVN